MNRSFSQQRSSGLRSSTSLKQVYNQSRSNVPGQRRYSSQQESEPFGMQQQTTDYAQFDERVQSLFESVQTQLSREITNIAVRFGIFSFSKNLEVPIELGATLGRYTLFSQFSIERVRPPVSPLTPQSSAPLLNRGYAPPKQ